MARAANFCAFRGSRPATKPLYWIGYAAPGRTHSRFRLGFCALTDVCFMAAKKGRTRKQSAFEEEAPFGVLRRVFIPQWPDGLGRRGLHPVCIWGMEAERARTRASIFGTKQRNRAGQKVKLGKAHFPQRNRRQARANALNNRHLAAVLDDKACKRKNSPDETENRSNLCFLRSICQTLQECQMQSQGDKLRQKAKFQAVKTLMRTREGGSPFEV